MNRKIKIILVDDHNLFRESLSFLLSKSKKIEIIAEAENGEVFLKLLDKMIPDVVLMDINMPNMDGIEATKRALERYPNLKIIALSMNGDEAYYYKMIQVGAKGFVLKKASSEELEEAIETVLNGNDFFSPELMKNIIINFGSTKEIKTDKGPKYINLSNRENDVLKLICNGFTTKEISNMLFISTRTVEGHKSRIMDKLDAQNTANIIIQAIRNKLIDI
ncbi:MAG: hypothetical protein A2041_00510 [Bacteroidetes bacterium GWA2_31_9b]|nr:MAG: hypothetical protein A2041_00510 [Bacteroidetes bacterium GWA2_31_9b]